LTERSSSDASSIAGALSRGETKIEAIRFGMAAAVENAPLA